MTKAAKKETAVKATKQQETKGNKKEIDVSAISKLDVSDLNGKSAKIRFYLSKGFERNVIAAHLGIRYQHVRNVEVTQLKKKAAK